MDMNMWMALYRLYCLKIFPTVKNLRGSHKVFHFLKERAEREVLSYKDVGYCMDLNGVEVCMREKDSFQEVLGSNPVKGYVHKYDIQEGDTVIDAGAFPGVFTVYAAKKAGRNGKVVALEPDEENMEKLKKNVRLNGLENVEFVQKGLWDSEGKLKFDERGLKSSRIVDSSEEGTLIDVCDIDSLVENLDIENVDFIKMDIEGAEIEALEGAEKVLREQSPKVAVASYHVRDGEKTCYKVEDMVESVGLEAETGYYDHLTTYGS